MSTSYKVISYDIFSLLVTFSFGYFLVSEILVVLPVEKKINRHNFDLNKRNQILRNGATWTWLRWNFYRKYCVYSSHFMPEDDVKRSDWFKHLTSFSATKYENHADFFGKRSIALEFLSSHFRYWKGVGCKTECEKGKMQSRSLTWRAFGDCKTRHGVRLSIKLTYISVNFQWD